MDKNPEDEVVITAMLKRFSENRLPRALEIEKQVQAGGTLTESDLAFLETVFKDAKYVMNLTDKYPEYQELATKAIQMYSDITKQALENEKNPPK